MIKHLPGRRGLHLDTEPSCAGSRPAANLVQNLTDQPRSAIAGLGRAINATRQTTYQPYPLASGILLGRSTQEANQTGYLLP